MSMEITIEQVNYSGWANCWKISNGTIEMVVTGDVGPRIIRFGFRGGQNLFKNYPEQIGKSGEAEWMIRGGARLWIAPEDTDTTYALDNGPIDIQVDGSALVATEPVDEAVNIQKQMIVKMAEIGTAVEVIHRIRNASSIPSQFAPWALAVMAPGGVGVTGFPPRGTHPEVLPPTNPLVMWAFTDLSDPRWIFSRKYLALKQATGAPQKIGHFNPHTWGAYYLKGEVFIKRYEADPSRTFPDFGCSFEMFTNENMLELETVGPLSRVLSGEWMEHTEYWSLHRNVQINSWNDAELDRVLLPLL